MAANNDDFLQLPHKVRQARKLAGLTQLELAEKAGVGKSLVFNLEKGSAKISLENIFKILKVLNIKTEFTLPFLTGNKS